jgi:hypothetical protein
MTTTAPSSEKKIPVETKLTITIKSNVPAEMNAVDHMREVEKAVEYKKSIDGLTRGNGNAAAIVEGTVKIGKMKFKL